MCVCKVCWSSPSVPIANVSDAEARARAKAAARLQTQSRIEAGLQSKILIKKLVWLTLCIQVLFKLNLLILAFRGGAGSCSVQLNKVVMQVQEQRAGLQMQNTCSVELWSGRNRKGYGKNICG